MIGLDTGFFLELVSGNEQAVSLWQSCLDARLNWSFLVLLFRRRSSCPRYRFHQRELVEATKLKQSNMEI